MALALIALAPKRFDLLTTEKAYEVHLSKIHRSHAGAATQLSLAHIHVCAGAIAERIARSTTNHETRQARA